MKSVNEGNLRSSPCFEIQWTKMTNWINSNKCPTSDKETETLHFLRSPILSPIKGDHYPSLHGNSFYVCPTSVHIPKYSVSFTCSGTSFVQHYVCEVHPWFVFSFKFSHFKWCILCHCVNIHCLSILVIVAMWVILLLEIIFNIHNAVKSTLVYTYIRRVIVK